MNNSEMQYKAGDLVVARVSGSSLGWNGQSHRIVTILGPIFAASGSLIGWNVECSCGSGGKRFNKKGVISPNSILRKVD